MAMAPRSFFCSLEGLLRVLEAVLFKTQGKQNREEEYYPVEERAVHWLIFPGAEQVGPESSCLPFPVIWESHAQK